MADAAQQVELLNDSYGPMNLFTQFFIIGGVYFLGPDILSRNFLSRDGRAARRSAAIALLGSGNIINILSGAYSIYTPGVIFPLLIAILVYGKRSIRKPLWLAAVATGGCFGLAATFMDEVLVSWGVPESVVSNLSLIGMGVSLVLAMMSVRWDRQAYTEKEQNSSHL